MAPAFSPCGKRLLIMGAQQPVPYSVSILRGVRLLSVDLATGRMETVMDDSWTLAFAAWTPDGERVVVAATRDSPLPLPNIDLWVVNRDGSGATCRTEGSLGNVGLRIHHDMPTWGSGQPSFLVADDFSAYATVTRRGCGEIWRWRSTGP
jgi:Tol biopolymer transport system component